MKKKLLNWILFTILAGVFPFIISSIVCKSMGKAIEFSEVCAELLFFALMIVVEALNDLQEVYDRPLLKKVLVFSLIITLIVIASFYGIAVHDSHSEIISDWSIIETITWVSIGASAVTGLMVKFLGGQKGK